jgi:GxxExxY protein
VRYENQVVGSFSLDLLIESKVVVEVKAAERYAGVFEAQL